MLKLRNTFFTEKKGVDLVCTKKSKGEISHANCNRVGESSMDKLTKCPDIGQKDYLNKSLWVPVRTKVIVLFSSSCHQISNQSGFMWHSQCPL